MCLSPLHRSTEPLSVRVRIAKSTVTCRMLIAYAVPGGIWPSRPWKMTCWSEIWSAIIPPCGVQCKGNECRDLPMMSLVPGLSCFRPSLRNIHTGLRHVHAHGRKLPWPQNLLPKSTRVWIVSSCQFCASTNDGLTLMLST